VIAPVAAKVPVVVGETGDSAAGPEIYLPSFLPWASAHGLNVVAWTWNAWGDPDDVLVTNMQTGAPTSGEGVLYRGWLAAQPVPSPAPAQTKFAPPGTGTVVSKPPTKTAPPAGGATPRPATHSPSPKAGASAPAKSPLAVAGKPVDALSVQPLPMSAADVFALRVLYVGFALIGLAAFLWGAAHVGVLASGLFGRAVRA
jgi:hypothetical protein